jgi:quinol monooxygenase YgiN
MKPIALIVRHRTKPGMRPETHNVWEQYIKPHANSNPGHMAYFFCYDSDNETGITAFQIFTDKAAKDAFLTSEWYPEYLEKISAFIVEPPQIVMSELVWSKGLLQN